MNRYLTISIIALAISFGHLGSEAQAMPKKKKEEENAKPPKKFVQNCAPGTEQYGEGYPYSSKVVCRQPLTRGKFRAEGAMTAWHANGKKKFEGEYSRGTKHGIWTTYNRNGKVRWVDTYYAGKRQTRTKFDRYGRPIVPAAAPNAQEANNQQNNQQVKKKKISWRFMRNK